MDPSQTPSTAAQASDARDHSTRSLKMVLLFALDASILYVGLVVAAKVRWAEWMWPHAASSMGTVAIVLTVYATALGLSGAYRRMPRRMHLREFLHLGAGLLAAFVGSITLTYLATPADLLPRSISAVHFLFSIVGILGLRAVARQAHEWLRPSRPAPLPGSASLPKLHDFVDRPRVHVDTARLRNALEGRTVLVTGAGGSIGSELCDQLVGLQPRRIVLVDMSEYNLFRLEQRLQRRRSTSQLEFCIADIRDAVRMGRVFDRFKPDVVLHTAAYKHVPLMEHHPDESFRNNTLATAQLLQHCEAHDTDQFVFVSTDKAVEPSSILGATKRLAEWYVQVADSPVRRKIVRFGNVFGSQGSVVPLFEERLQSGEPLPITHPEMERYFMTAHEACSLILQTLLLEGYPIYVLRMGRPVRIEWLARQMIEQRRPEVPADRLIEYIGRRPGEKLSEELAGEHEALRPIDHPSIVGVERSAPSVSRAELERRFDRITSLCRHGDLSDETLRQALFAADAFLPADRIARGDGVPGDPGDPDVSASPDVSTRPSRRGSSSR